MYRIYLVIFLLLIAVNVFADDKPNNPCANNVCIAAWNFGSYFGFGQSSTTAPAGDTYYVLLETGDTELLETGDKLLKEDAP